MTKLFCDKCKKELLRRDRFCVNFYDPDDDGDGKYDVCINCYNQIKGFIYGDYKVMTTGQWVLQPDKKHAMCSECHTLRDIETQVGWKHCPECGAEMKGAF